jgi:hypothetical protein
MLNAVGIHSDNLNPLFLYNIKKFQKDLDKYAMNFYISIYVEKSM